MKCILLAIACLLCSCGRDAASVAIGSKNFVEQWLLGEIAAQQLERKLHVPVERRLNLGGTLIAHQAIVKGDIDIYPEYLGTAANVVLRPHAGQSFSQVRAAYLARFDLLWLPPLGFNDTFAMVVRQEDAAALTAPTLTAARQRGWRLGIGYEFLTRADGLRTLDETYHVPWQGTPRSLDLGLLYEALAQKRIDMAAANSTDAQLAGGNFTALRDDRRAFPPYDASFVVRRDLVKRNPAVVSALGLLQGRLDETAMREMNRRVIVGHESVAKVAQDFLALQP